MDIRENIIIMLRSKVSNKCTLKADFHEANKGPSINYVTLKLGKIDPPPPPVTPPSRMPKKMDAPLPVTSRFWDIFTSPNT